jgi:N-acetylglucosamine kinase-like BadF-type ATPase
MIYVSVDGGATKTIAICYSEDGNIKGIGCSGSSNYRNSGISVASENIKLAIKGSMEEANITDREVAKYTFALAGIKESVGDHELIYQLTGIRDSGKVSILNDGEAGFDCRFPGKDGIVACPGTGMIAYGRKGNKFLKSSGWGWILGDEGGGFYTARKALQEIVKIFDNRSDVASKLPEYSLKYFEIQEPRQLINKIYTDPMKISYIASFTSVVGNLADEGDELAIKIIKESAIEASNCVISLKEKLFSENYVEFSGYGGLYKATKIYWETLVNSVKAQFPDMIAVPPLYGYHAILGSMYIVLIKENKDIKFDISKEVDLLESHVLKLSKEKREKFLFLK